MKIAVMGAGAVGCYFGAMLARAGHDVVLIGRAALVDGVARDGLKLQSVHFTVQVPIAAHTSPAAVADADLVLFCVKSGDTESAGDEMRPYLSPEASVLSLQNGVDNAPRLATTLARPVVPVVVYVAAEMAGPAHVLHHGRGDLVLGPFERGDAVITLLNEAGIPAQISAQVFDALWAKLVLNCAYNAISAIAQQPYGGFIGSPGILETMRNTFDECAAVARADGIALPEDLWEKMLALSRSMPGQRSSTAQDLARGKPSEIAHLNGYVVRRGKALGVATPVNQALESLVLLLEGRRQG